MLYRAAGALHPAEQQRADRAEKLLKEQLAKGVKYLERLGELQVCLPHALTYSFYLDVLGLSLSLSFSACLSQNC